MKKKVFTITIGISAYNEEANIGNLITNILDQNLKNIDLKKIIVVSDGSTDKTVSTIKSYKDKRIDLLVHKNRLGKIYGLSEIIRKSKTDILVTLDADIVLANKNFLQNISAPITKNKKVGLVGGDTVSIEARNFFEKVIASSHKFKNEMYRKINGSDNLFLCHGRALAFNKKFYKNIEFINNYPTDAQTYLFCITKGFQFKYQRNAKVLFRSPSTLSDHKKQHSRFVAGEKSFGNVFDKNLIKKEYYIPFPLKIRLITRYFVFDPIDMICYSIIYSYLKIFNSDSETYQAKWEISNSTKEVIS